MKKEILFIIIFYFHLFQSNRANDYLDIDFNLKPLHEMKSHTEKFGFKFNKNIHYFLHKNGFSKILKGSLDSNINENFEILCESFKMAKNTEEVEYIEWHTLIQNYFNGLKYIFEKRPTKGHHILKSTESIETFSMYYILYTCLMHQKYRPNFSQIEFQSKYDLKGICPNPCLLERCDHIPYAIKGSCKSLPKALFYGDYKCSCASPYIWDQKHNTCIMPNKCLKDCPKY